MTAIVFTCKNSDGYICKLYFSSNGDKIKELIQSKIDYFQGRLLIEEFIAFAISDNCSWSDVFVYSSNSDIFGDINCELIHNGREIILKE